MAERYIVVGDGITAERRLQFDLNDLTEATAIAAHLPAWNASRSFFENTTAQQFAHCEKLIAKLGRGPHSPGTVGDLARQYLHLHRSAVANGAKGETDLAMTQAAQAGGVFATLEIKLAWERPALSGHKRAVTLDDLRIANNQKRASAHQRQKVVAQAAADRIWADRPRLSKTAVAHLLQQRGTVKGKKADTIAGWLKKVPISR